MRALLTCLFLLFSQHCLADKRVALVVGNAGYELAPLQNSLNDAKDVAAALRRLNFRVILGLDLTTKQFDQAIEEFALSAKDADVAFFYFSGHGVQIDKRGFLAPTGIKVESESSALRELVSIPEVVSKIENAAKASVIVLDACRNSPLQERMRRLSLNREKGFAQGEGLPPITVTGSNTLVVYSTVPGEVAWEGEGHNSYFTSELLKQLETPGLEIESMFKRVTAGVLKATNGKQQPERLSRLQVELILLPQEASAQRIQPGRPDGTAVAKQETVAQTVHVRVTGFRLESLQQSMKTVLDRELRGAGFTDGANENEASYRLDVSLADEPDKTPAGVDRNGILTWKYVTQLRIEMSANPSGRMLLSSEVEGSYTGPASANSQAAARQSALSKVACEVRSILQK